MINEPKSNIYNNVILNKFVRIGFNWGIYNNIYLYVYMY